MYICIHVCILSLLLLLTDAIMFFFLKELAVVVVMTIPGEQKLLREIVKWPSGV